MRKWALLLLTFWLAGCAPAAPVSSTAVAATAVATPPPTFLPLITHTPAPPPVYGYRVVNRYPHDANAFTQGLVWHEGVVYEGTGLSREYGGISTLRRVDLETGEVQQMITLPDQYFGEGIVVWQDTIIQLTWRNRVGFVYDRESFALLRKFNYDSEGWGITHDGERLIVSDGTDTLYFWDPETLLEIGRVAVYDLDGPITRLNELEYINGEVWANVWLTDRIARIDPQNGRVTAWVDLSGLLDGVSLPRPPDVLNGIMFDATNGRLFVTGKYWPLLFEIEIKDDKP